SRAACQPIHASVTGHCARNEKILIHGAAGSVSSACVELARHLHLHITATCRAIDCDHVRSLGADHVIAFDRTDFSESAATGMLSSIWLEANFIAGRTNLSAEVVGSST